MIYKMPLRTRLRHARYNRERWQRDPEFRLRRINARREQRGQPPYASLAEIPERQPRGERGKLA
jgi:hypothetical protein